MSGQAPLTRTYSVIIPGAAANADFVATICAAEFAGTLTEAFYIADTAITGADTESRTLNILNQGTDGATGTAVTMATKAFVSGTNAAQYHRTDLALSGTAANLDVEVGDVLTVQSLHVGTTGLADPGGTVFVTLSRA